MQLEQHSPTEQHDCISVKNVSFSYGAEAALENVSFTITRGDYVGIIGPNGAGKTTLLKLILGLLKPQQGTVSVFGRDVFTNVGERAHIGYVPQHAVQVEANFPASVAEVVASGRTARVGLFKGLRATDHEAIQRAMDITGVTEYHDRLIGSLSGGQRQRVFIARALAGEPQVLILDEPTVGVDIASQQQFFSFIADLNKQYGLTILLVSHDIDAVAKEVKSLLCINKRLICQGPATELLTEQYMQELYGSHTHYIHHDYHA